jgi:hypothetical protein
MKTHNSILKAKLQHQINGSISTEDVGVFIIEDPIAPTSPFLSAL